VKTTNPQTPLTADAAAAFAHRVRGRGGVVVFANGVFDILHPGHVRYLSEARALGDALIVAVNSDRSVRVNKGPSRPVNGERERADWGADDIIGRETVEGRGGRVVRIRLSPGHSTTDVITRIRAGRP
jgi:D-beta-D-heptose 7-phosphate kinase/D-beta-D-heptose 1-phosphate adenosyltransferase